MRAKGCGIIVIGEDLDELLMLCDRIAVMYEGRIAGTLDSADATDRAARPADDRGGRAEEAA